VAIAYTFPKLNEVLFHWFPDGKHHPAGDKSKPDPLSQNSLLGKMNHHEILIS
jgi:hypothetical protein